MPADNRIDGGVHMDPSMWGRDVEQFHTVRDGDTLRSIAADYRISEETILNANAQLRELGEVRPGMSLLIPEK